MKHNLLLTALVAGLLSGCGSRMPANREVEVPETPEGTASTRPVLIGGDISELSYVEQNGGKYYRRDGTGPEDCIKILAEGGFNIVRLRLYNDPGNPGYSPSKRLPAGVQDEADILSLARRAKEAGMQIELTFHYSDYWTNGETQTKPHEWENLDYAALKQAVYDYTAKVLQDLAAQNTLPEFVSLGNETQGGLLYPDGKYDRMDQLCELYNAGSRAVREVAPGSKVILHLDDGGNPGKYTWYFDEMKKYGVDYDVIGASYYPFWTGKTVREFGDFAMDVLERYPGKQMMVMETGYAWSRYLPNGYPGQLKDNGPYTDISPRGQRIFMAELLAEIRRKERILGVLYWDPVFIEVPGIGWELGGANVVSNTTLFDFGGRALEVFEAFANPE